MPQIHDFCHSKLAFIEVAIKFVLMKACEDKVKISCMFFSCFCNHDDVIQVCKADFPDEVMEDSMHCLLKHTGGVGEPKRHHCPLVQAIRGAKCCLGLGSFINADLVIP